MRGDSIIGLGLCHNRHARGQEGNWFPSGLSPRDCNRTLNLLGGLDDIDGCGIDWENTGQASPVSRRTNSEISAR